MAPVVSVVCNFTRPTSNAPALLTLDEAETLFHEFGHALHFLFHDVRYRGLTEVEGDFVELPSQLMENWAFDPEMLKQYAVNYRSDEVIPQYLVDKLRKSKLFNQGFMTTELIAASLSDMDIHSMTEYEPFDPEAFEREALTEKRGLIPQIEPRYHYPYFSHIFDGGYSAGYYFYTWAAVLDKDVFEAFRESGDLFNKRIADDFRRKVLARGGSADGMTLYRDFRGKDPDKRPMLRAPGRKKKPNQFTDPFMKKAFLIMAISAMAAGCADNSIPTAQLPELDLSNPLLAAWETPHATPPFSKIELRHYEPAFDAAIACSRAEVKAIVENPKKPTFGNTVVALERSGALLARIEGIFFNMLGAETSDEMQQIALRVQPKLTELENDISLDTVLFARVKAVYEHPGRLGQEDRMLLEKTYKRFNWLPPMPSRSTSPTRRSWPNCPASSRREWPPRLLPAERRGGP